MQIAKGSPISAAQKPTAVVNVGDNPPQNVVQGLLWVDTSNGNFILKVYDGATWQIVQADVYFTKIDGGNL
jgi:hypothetical protein